MGQVHWTHRFNWTALVIGVLACSAFVVGMGIIADALKTSRDQVSLTINNEGDAKAFRYVDGKFIQVPLVREKK